MAIATWQPWSDSDDQHRAVVADQAGAALAVGGRGARLPVRDRAEHVAEGGEEGQSAAEKEGQEEEGSFGDFDVME